MSSSTKAHSGHETVPDFETLVQDFEAVKRDLAAMASKFTTDFGNGASDEMHEAVNDLSERASHLYESLSAQGGRSVKTVSDRVEERPLTSLLAAFVVGFVACKVLWR